MQLSRQIVQVGLTSVPAACADVTRVLWNRLLPRNWFVPGLHLIFVHEGWLLLLRLHVLKLLARRRVHLHCSLLHRNFSAPGTRVLLPEFGTGRQNATALDLPRVRRHATRVLWSVLCACTSWVVRGTHLGFLRCGTLVNHICQNKY